MKLRSILSLLLAGSIFVLNSCGEESFLGSSEERADIGMQECLVIIEDGAAARLDLETNPGILAEDLVYQFHNELCIRTEEPREHVTNFQYRRLEEACYQDAAISMQFFRFIVSGEADETRRDSIMWNVGGIWAFRQEIMELFPSQSPLDIQDYRCFRP